MYVIVDSILRVREFGRRGGFRANQVRFYYIVEGYPNLVLRCDEQPYQEWDGKPAVALFEFNGVDGHKLLSHFPKAPARWGDEHLVQVTIRPEQRPVEGPPQVTFSEAVRQALGGQ